MSPASERGRSPAETPRGGVAAAEPTPPFLDDLLEKTSRTFALSVPRLPEPTRREVTVAYLLFRVADTLEDATLWNPGRRLRELADLDRFLESPSRESAVALASRWASEPPCDHEGYRELLERLPELADVLVDLPAGARDLVVLHTRRTATRMASFVERGHGGVGSLADLRDYCYAVAGIVGEMLTELFLLDHPVLEPRAAALRRRAATFGEALQLVNILKDAATDADEGRRFLPDSCGVKDVFALARADLKVAEEYVACLAEAEAHAGLQTFCALPVMLAWHALDAVQQRGPGVKVPRAVVGELVSRLDRAVTTGTVGALFEEIHDRTG